MEKFFDSALAQAESGINNQEGGPFGAVIVLHDTIVGLGHNTVLKDNDPTAHAEINAIRDACRNLKRYNLQGAILISTCEPCPMCLSAIVWARVASVVYGCDRYDAASVGFDDERLYERLRTGSSADLLRQVTPATVDKCREIMHRWAQQPHTLY